MTFAYFSPNQDGMQGHACIGPGEKHLLSSLHFLFWILCWFVVIPAFVSSDSILGFGADYLEERLRPLKPKLCVLLFLGSFVLLSFLFVFGFRWDTCDPCKFLGSGVFGVFGVGDCGCCYGCGCGCRGCWCWCYCWWCWWCCCCPAFCGWLGPIFVDNTNQGALQTDQFLWWSYGLTCWNMKLADATCGRVGLDLLTERMESPGVTEWNTTDRQVWSWMCLVAQFCRFATKVVLFVF